MTDQNAPTYLQWGRPGRREEDGGPLAARLRQVVDAGLIATICGAPFVFGGRHELGRLVFVSLVAITAIAWFLRQSILPTARWNRTTAHGLLALAVGLVALQLVPLPVEWVARLSPRTAELLPLWTPAEGVLTLGAWSQLSFNPSATSLGLATLLSYGLLFVVVTQRMCDVNDVRRVLSWVAIAAVMMAVFGLAQLFGSNGRYFGFYEVPFRSTEFCATGSFMNRNHFASFLVLGIGPLVAWLLTTARGMANAKRHRPISIVTQLPAIALAISLLIVMLAVALSQSRGGALALITAMTVLAVIYWRWQLVDLKYLCGLVGLGLALMGALSIYGYEQLATRLDDFTEGTLEAVDRDAGRRDIWAANRDAILAGGLTGAGVGTHRDIAPVYLRQFSNQHYTHAENGYLQMATETGLFGACLLIAGIGLVAGWCIRCMRDLRATPERLCFGAVAAGLAASVVHSFVDFVWYIPATMSVTLVLAACVLRLSQFALPEERCAAVRPVLKRSRWLEMAGVATVAGAWATYVYFGPAMAALSWDNYLRCEIANSRLVRQEWAAKIAGLDATSEQSKDALADAMLRQLRQSVRWNPNFAAAHFELAQRYLDTFELRQQEAANAMGVVQIAEAAAASRFDSPAELRAWLDRALGENAALLYQAQDHARRAVALCPLNGEAYILLANLSFLEAEPRPSIQQYAEQGLRVRPWQAAVLFETGRQRMAAGDLEDAIRFWAACANNPGPHQLRIVQALAGEFMPASEYVRLFQPDWRTLREIWTRYKQRGRPQDLVDLVDYAHQVTQRQSTEHPGTYPAYLWLFQASMYAELERPEDSLVCLEKAYSSGPHIYAVRFAIGRALLTAGRFAEAEPHVRWCLARRPENKALSAALVEITKQRFAQRTSGEPR